MVSDPKLCVEFIDKLERFANAAHDVRRKIAPDVAQEYRSAKDDMLNFVEKHFDLKK